MIESGAFIALALILLGLLLGLLYSERSKKRRLASESDLLMEHRVPRHYKDFVEVEKKLWQAADNYKHTDAWEFTRLTLRPVELKVVRDYLQGLREDFRRGNRIFGAVILHSPNTRILGQLEWQRSKLQFSFRFWYMVISMRLGWNAVSVDELRRLTEIVATLAYHVRTMLKTFEESGNAKFVEWILRNS
jgi:hypothetical protein